MIKGLIGAIIVLLIATFPATRLLKMFIGNNTLPGALGYWGT